MRQKSFETAAARRRKDPIIWVIDGQEVRLRPSLDLAEIAPLIESLSAPVPEGANQLVHAASKRNELVATVRAFVDEASYHTFDDVAADLDFDMLREMVEDLIGEYAGTANPSKQPSSSDGSSTTGSSSTAGAVPETSTPSA